MSISLKWKSRFTFLPIYSLNIKLCLTYENRILHKIILIGLIFLLSCTPQLIKKPIYDYSRMDEDTKEVHLCVESFLNSCIKFQYPVKISRYSKIDSVVIEKNQQLIDIHLNPVFAWTPFREDDISLIYFIIRDLLDSPFDKYSITIFCKNFPIEQLVPNYYRKSKVIHDISRIPEKEIRSKPVVRRINDPWKPENGLYNRNIALWHSHGWYYEQRLKRWEWQRARLFQTVEDLGPISFTIPYLIPMLENAGANVFVPRERDVQVNEVVVDNDTYSDSLNWYKEQAIAEQNFWKAGYKPGFAIGNQPYTIGINPFKLGTYRQCFADSTASARINWIPNIPQSGEYSVYISYSHSDSNVTDAHYSIYHSGGKTEFLVNQQIGGETWIYLGKYLFKKGQNGDIGKVELTNQTNESGKYVTADAVRFGGGMGVVERGGSVSGRPKFVEAARYYLQYAGMPDTLVYNLHADTLDYNDDYKCRAEWVNYLKGAPYGPNRDREAKGLGIPIDLSLAFHTDAGISPNDTVIGTLSIYSTEDAESLFVFPDAVSRLANRDFADILQTQIVEDLRKKWDVAWNRRGLWDRMYSEAWRPNVPAALLELISHQNFLDMKFFHEPLYKFDVSRAIYKSMLKFLSVQYQFNFVVQPLPVKFMQTEFSGKNEITLKWQPQIDSLESTAIAEKYIVYIRKDDNNFDNGRLVNNNIYKFSEAESGVIYSFKVSAVNSGGESFPSEILSVCRMDNEEKPVLIVNGFDRICAPATIESQEFTGFADFLDQGVPDKYDIGFTGSQFNYTPPSKWSDDDSPGFGASYADFETTVIPGNTFDFPYLHGTSIKEAGYSFVSVSDEAAMDGFVDMNEYNLVDLILGEERKTEFPKSKDEKHFEAFPPKLKEKLQSFCKSGGNLLVSGSYIGADLFENENDTTSTNFALNTLKIKFRTNFAAKTGGINIVHDSFNSENDSFIFNTKFNSGIYAAEAPDAIEPADSLGHTFLRYSENNISAGVLYNDDYKVVTIGFPFETIINKTHRHLLMADILKFLHINHK